MQLEAPVRWIVSPSRLAAIAAAGCVVFAAARGQAQSFTPSNEAFQINDFTAGCERLGDVERLADDRFVVVWSQTDQYTFSIRDEQGVFGRVMTLGGAPLTGRLDLATDLTRKEYQPDLSVAAGGDFVVVWVSEGETIPDPSDIALRRFDSTGTPLSAEVFVDGFPNGRQRNPSVTHLSSGDFVVTWQGCDSLFQDIFCFTGSSSGAEYDVFARRFDASATPLGAPFLVNTYTTGGQGAPKIAALDDGGFVIAWSTIEPSTNVAARRYDAAGSPIGAPFAVSSYASASGATSHVEPIAGGGFVIAWHRADVTLGPALARTYDATGAPIGPEFPVSPFVTGHQRWPSMLTLDDGRLLTAFAHRPYSLVNDLVIAELDSITTSIGPTYLGMDLLPSSPGPPKMATTNGASFVVAWEEQYDNAARLNPLGRDGNCSGVFVRAFCADGDADCDVCPGFDDTIDTDGDGVADGCDPCTNVAGSQDAGRRRIQAHTGGFPLEKNRRVKLTMEFEIPGAFATIDPGGEGVRVRTEGRGGGAIMDVRFPPGLYAGSGTSGWRTNGKQSKWKYVGADAAGIRDLAKISIVDRSSKSPNLVSIKAKGRAGNYLTTVEDLPVRVQVTLGDEGAASAGMCGEATFTSVDCDFAHPKMKCSAK